MSNDPAANPGATPTVPDPWEVPAPAIPEAWTTAEFVREADALFGRYPRRINALLPILQLAAAHHPLTAESLPHMARLCWATTEQALRVAQAYGLLRADSQVPTVTFCINVHCQRNGSEALRDACRTVLQGQPVVFREYVCFGYCEEGPCVEVNDRLIVAATAPKIVAVLAEPSR
jgi:NADH:ubiquinone oxidoreductase subunit E